MELLIKIVLTLTLFLLRFYRVDIIWSALSEKNQIKCNSISPNRKDNDPRECNIWLKCILIVYLLYTLFSEPASWFTVVGFLIFMFGWTMAVDARRILDKSWADASQIPIEKQSLISEGPYAWCRNPIYVGFFLEWVGFIIICGWALMNQPVFWLSLVIVFGKTLYYYHKLVLAEENYLLKMYVDAYSQYRKNVPRYLFINGFLAQISNS